MSTKQTSTTQSKTEPWRETLPALRDLIGQLDTGLGNTGITAAESGALDQLQANANQPNQNIAGMDKLASDLFSGGPDRTGIVNDAYKSLQDRLNPVANGENLKVDSNPYIRSFVDSTNSGVRNAVNSQFAAAGRSFSGAHAGTLAKNLADSENSVYMNEFDKERGRSDAAMRDLYTAGNTTAGMLSDLDTKGLQNRTAGIDIANAANALRDQPATRTLEIEAMRRGLPLSNVSQIADMLVPIAGLGQQGTSTTTTKGNALQTAIGGVIGGAGMLGKMGAFGPAGWLSQPLSGFSAGLLSR